MAILTDGSTTLTTMVDETINPIDESSHTRTGGGNERTVVGGERLQIKLKLRLTPAQLRTLKNIINSNANSRFYTPNDSTASFWADLYPDLTFPLNSTFSRATRKWDNRKRWYTEVIVTSVEYL